MMRIYPASPKSALVIALLALLVVASGAAAQDRSAVSSGATAPRPLITQPVDAARLTVLNGNTHPLARPEFDQGIAPASLPMQRMLLVLKRSPEQESALRTLLDGQQDKTSPNYHKWLTPGAVWQAVRPRRQRPAEGRRRGCGRADFKSQLLRKAEP